MRFFKRLFFALDRRKVWNFLPDKWFLKLKYHAVMGKRLNIKAPVTFSEKMQWLKLYNRVPEYIKMADKYAVREYIKETIGEDYLVPLLGVWDTPEEIDFGTLPERFVLKCNHNSGLGMCICTDKSSLDTEQVKRNLKKGLKQNYYLTGREWPYKDIPRKIIAEQFLDDGTNRCLKDYKIYCFNGEPVYCQVISDRDTDERIDFYDLQWNRMTFTGLAEPGNAFQNADDPIEKPLTWESMQKAARTLAQGIPFLRVDFYEVQGKTFFGEITFYPAAGLGEFTPPQWNTTLGDMLRLRDK